MENVRIERRETAAIVTIDRPEARNALNRQTLMELRDAMRELAADDEILSIVLTGAGEKAFVAGADVVSLGDRTMLQTLANENQVVLSEIAEIQKPTIAAINGFALGGGCELALACDIRIASENARLGFPELGLGFMPGAGGTQRLAKVVGTSQAKELIFTGDILRAEAALKIGLVSKVVPLAELLPAAMEICGKIAKKAPWAVRMAKVVIGKSTDVDLQTGLLIERLGQAVLFGTEDRMEGVTSFIEKRDPHYKGR